MVMIERKAPMGSKVTSRPYAGRAVDLDPCRFTLGDVFAMRLDVHHEAVEDICCAALKELGIEAELRKIAEAWRAQRFELHPYGHKAQEQQTFVIKGTCLHRCS